MATSTLLSTQSEPPSEPLNKHFIDGALSTKHNAALIFQRRIQFKESTKPDHKMDALKKKYRPINEIINPATAQHNGHDGNTNGGEKSHQNGSVNGAATPLEDENGFRHPARILFDKNQLTPTWRQVRPIGSGLHNLGFTCYLNSVLQCLSYTPALANYLLAGEHSRSCRSIGPCMFCEVEKHVQRSFSGSESGRAFSPKNLAGKLRLIGKTLRVGRQEDSHEFMMSLLDTIIRNLLANFDSKMDERVKETTVIHQIFGGHLLSQVKCLQCKRESNKFDGFTDLSLEIKNASSIEQAFRQFTRAEYLVKNDQYKCEKCKKYVDAQKQLTIYRPPLVLNIHLKRFEYAGPGGSKIGKHVRFSETLDLREFVSPGQRGGVGLYRLYAVLVHQGKSCSSGHYYCFVRASSGAWYCMDDESVTQVGLATVLNKPAYMLFYTQVIEEEKKSKGETGQQTVKKRCEEADGLVQSSKKARLDGSEAGQASSYKARAQVQMQGQVQETKRKADESASASGEARANGLPWVQTHIRIERSEGKQVQVPVQVQGKKRKADGPPISGEAQAKRLLVDLAKGFEGEQANNHKAQAQAQVQGKKRKADRAPASGEAQVKHIMVDPAEGLEEEQASNHKAQAQAQAQVQAQVQETKRKTDALASGETQANELAQEQKPIGVDGREVGEAVDRRTFMKERMHANESAKRHVPPVVHGHKPPAVNGNRPPVVNRHAPPVVHGHKLPTVNGDRPLVVNGHGPPAVNGHKPPVVNGDKPPAINGNKLKGLTPFKSPASFSKYVSEDAAAVTSILPNGTSLELLLSKRPPLKLNSLLPTPSPSPSVDDIRSPPPAPSARNDSVPVPVTTGSDRWVVSPVMEQRALPPKAQATVSSVLKNEEKWTVKNKGVEGKETPPVEGGEARSKHKLSKEGAVVVNYNDKMEAKRAKLDELVERETAVGRSLEVKEEILGVGIPKGQFGGSVDRWDGSSTDADREAALRRTLAPKSRTSQYDLDYDRGKVKKMKKRNKTRWHEENIFQREANVQNAIKENRFKSSSRSNYELDPA